MCVREGTEDSGEVGADSERGAQTVNKKRTKKTRGIKKKSEIPREERKRQAV